MKTTRRHALQSLAGLTVLAGTPASFTALAQSRYPTGPVHFVIPTAAGGGYDTMMRLIGQVMHKRLGQPCIVESRPGASGAIAARTVASAAPNGQTVLIIYSSVLTNPLLMADAGYQLSDLQVVTQVSNSPIAFCVRKSLGVNTLPEFVELARKQPGKLSYASYGPGSGGHFVGELFKRAADLDLAHAPYKGEAPAIQDLLGEHVDAAVVSVGGASRHPDRIVPLAISGPRSQRYPDIPSFAEGGFPEVSLPGFASAFVPKATPPDIVARLQEELNYAVHQPDVAEKVLELGFEPSGWSTERSQKFLDDQLVVIKSLIDEGRITM